MEEQLISKETAKLAKLKKYNIPSYSYYDDFERDGYKKDGIHWLNLEESEPMINDKYKDDCYAAPTQGLLQKWLREKHGIHITVNYMREYQGTKIGEYHVIITNFNAFESTYEKALELGLQKALKLIKTI